MKAEGIFVTQIYIIDFCLEYTAIVKSSFYELKITFLCANYEFYFTEMEPA